MSDNPLRDLSDELKDFAQRRDWEQFHSPKNLSMALIAECAELVEHFQWMREEDSYQLDPARHDAVSMELADIFIYLLRLAERLDVDLMASARRKMAINEDRYPVEKVYGDSRRASEYDD